MRAVAIIGLMFLLAGCAQPSNKAVSTPSAIDAQVEALMQREDVKGMAIAVIEDGDVKHVAAFGYRNVEKQAPLETDTIMYGASLTKTAFSYMIMQLVDEGLFDLDKPLVSYLPKPLGR